MPRTARPFTARLTAGVALSLVAALAVGCSSDDGSEGADPTTTRPVGGGGGGGGGEADGGSVAGLLGLVPDTEANRGYVVVSLYAKAAEAADLPDPDGEDDELSRLQALTSDVATGTGLAGGELAGGPRAQLQYDALGFVPSEVTAEVAAGQPPSQVAIATGAFDADEVLARAAETEGAETVDVDGTEVVRWLDDSQVELELETPIGDLPGQAGRVAVPADGVLTYANDDATSTAAVEAVTGEGDALLDVAELAAVATALDDQEVHTAYLSTTPVEVGIGRLGPEQVEEAREQLEAEGLLPYEAVGSGGTLVDGKPRLVVVLVHADADDAATNAERLEDLVAEGTSFATGQPWAELLTDADVAQDGEVVTATFAVENPRLWFDLVLRGDNLLAVG